MVCFSCSLFGSFPCDFGPWQPPKRPFMQHTDSAARLALGADSDRPNVRLRVVRDDERSQRVARGLLARA